MYAEVDLVFPGLGWKGEDKTGGEQAAVFWRSVTHQCMSSTASVTPH